MYSHHTAYAKLIRVQEHTDNAARVTTSAQFPKLLLSDTTRCPISPLPSSSINKSFPEKWRALTRGEAARLFGVAHITGA